MIVPEFDYEMNSFNGEPHAEFGYYSNGKDQNLEMNNNY